jgi:hypothetical protein
MLDYYYYLPLVDPITVRRLRLMPPPRCRRSISFSLRRHYAAELDAAYFSFHIDILPTFSLS